MHVVHHNERVRGVDVGVVGLDEDAVLKEVVSGPQVLYGYSLALPHAALGARVVDREQKNGDRQPATHDE